MDCIDELPEGFFLIMQKIKEYINHIDFKIYIMHAVFHEPNNWFSWDTKNKIYYNLGNYKESGVIDF